MKNKASKGIKKLAPEAGPLLNPEPVTLVLFIAISSALKFPVLQEKDRPSGPMGLPPASTFLTTLYRPSLELCPCISLATSAAWAPWALFSPPQEAVGIRFHRVVRRLRVMCRR